MAIGGLQPGRCLPIVSDPNRHANRVGISVGSACAMAGTAVPVLAAKWRMI